MKHRISIFIQSHALDDVISPVAGIKFYIAKTTSEFWCILGSECGGTRWSTGGEVKGKLANGVGSQYSHKTSECCVSSITTADAHTSAASSRLNWLPRRFKWTRPFRRKTKSGFCACAIRFRTSCTNRSQNNNCLSIEFVWHTSDCIGWMIHNQIHVSA